MRLGLLASCAVLAVGFVAACSASSLPGEPAANPSLAKWERVDPCTLLTTDELRQNHVRTSGAPLNEGGETGCDFFGDPDRAGRAINLTKSPASPDSYLSRPTDFVSIKANTVNGRPGFQTRISSSNDECSQFMAVGSGVVSVATTRDKSGDPCGDVAELARIVQPRLPK